MTNAEKLLEAARLISEVRSSMNDRDTVCSHCGQKAKENWSEHQVAERLQELPQRLRRMASSDILTKSGGAGSGGNKINVTGAC